MGACASDVVRVPFVFAKEMNIDSVVPALPLFRVFAEFGCFILNPTVYSGGLRYYLSQPYGYALQEHLVGWVYHFSNGMTFGMMYLALIGDAAKRSWLWAVVLAVVLELGMLFTPYTRIFAINVTPTFVAVTLSAHVVFGAVLGLVARRLWIGLTIVRR